MATRNRSNAARLSPDGYRKLFGGDEVSTSVADGLEYVPHGGRAEPRKPTAEQIRQQARARDPESWKRAEAMRARKHEEGREASGDIAELYVRRLDEAIVEEDETLLLARAREFAQASPAAWRAWLAEQDEFVYQQADEMGLDPDDDEYPTDTEMPSYTLGGEVARAIELERSQQFQATLAERVGNLEQASLVVYNGRLKEKGKLPAPDDEQGNAYHAAIADYIYQTSGIHLAELVNDGKGDQAAEHYLRADAQLAAMDKEARLQVFKRGIVEQEDGSVAAGIKTSGDANAEQLAEITNLLRAQNGLGPADAPELRGYDPNFEPEQSQPEIAAPTSDAEIKRSVLDDTVSADGGADIRSGFTSDGAPVSYSEITRSIEAEQRTEREARENAAGIPRSFS